MKQKNYNLPIEIEPLPEPYKLSVVDILTSQDTDMSNQFVLK